MEAVNQLDCLVFGNLGLNVLADGRTHAMEKCNGTVDCSNVERAPGHIDVSAEASKT